jgi:capsular polysaccharide biosynthesis protein
MSLAFLRQAAWRRRRLWVSAVLLGVMVGAAFHLIVPRKYAAVSDVYMVEPSGSDPTEAMANDVSLLETRTVAERAIAALHLHVFTDSFLASYKGTSPSSVILAVTFTGPSQAQAVADDNAIVSAFLAVRTGELARQTDVLVDGLDTQLQSLDARITGLDKSINQLSSSPAGPLTADQLAGLISQRSSDDEQASSLDSQVQQDLLSLALVTKGTHVLNPAAVPRVSAKKVTAMDALTGLVGGLGLGLGGVVVWELLSDRPRRRAEVAAALNAPVELSIGQYQRCRWLRRYRLRWRMKNPGAALRMIERRLRARLEATPDSALAVVDLEATAPAALSVGVLALSLAGEGKRVVVADMAEGRPLARLLGPAPRDGEPRTVSFDRKGLVLVVAPDDPAQMAQKGAPPDVDATLVLTSVDPAFGCEHLAAWVSAAVVVLTAGRPTTSRVAAVGEMFRDAGIETVSAILVGTDENDDSIGRPPPERPSDRARARVPLQTSEVGLPLASPGALSADEDPSGVLRAAG